MEDTTPIELVTIFDHGNVARVLEKCSPMLFHSGVVPDMRKLKYLFHCLVALPTGRWIGSEVEEAVRPLTFVLA